VPDRLLRTLSTGYRKSNALAGAHPLNTPASDISRDGGDSSGWIAAADGDQFKRDLAAIERTAAILRRAEPALQSSAEPTPRVGTPRPLWLVIGALWLSTALVTLTAIFAVRVLVG
jgi:hypothetical protein